MISMFISLAFLAIAIGYAAAVAVYALRCHHRRQELWHETARQAPAG